MVDDTDGFREHRLLILAELQRLNGNYEALATRLGTLHRENNDRLQEHRDEIRRLIDRVLEDDARSRAEMQRFRDEVYHELRALEVRVTELKVKAAMIGGLAGAIPVLIGLAISIWRAAS